MIGIAIIVSVVIIIGIAWFVMTPPKKSSASVAPKQRYLYSKKDYILTSAETNFFKRLARVSEGRYIVFPQIHLSALMKNETKDNYRKVAFQRINRTSVDYVLVDKDTLKPVYAVELDDWSHDSEKRRARDTGVEEMFRQIELPLVRFRNPEKLTDNDIIASFAASKTNN